MTKTPSYLSSNCQTSNAYRRRILAIEWESCDGPWALAGGFWLLIKHWRMWREGREPRGPVRVLITKTSSELKYSSYCSNRMTFRFLQHFSRQRNWRGGCALTIEMDQITRWQFSWYRNHRIVKRIVKNTWWIYGISWQLTIPWESVLKFLMALLLSKWKYLSNLLKFFPVTKATRALARILFSSTTIGQKIVKYFL